MKRCYQYFFMVVLLCFFSLSLYAQKKDWGKINGSIDLQSAYYLKDNKSISGQEQEGFAINTYINLGYSFKNFNAGLQYEIYEPPLIGYSPLLKGNKLMIGFAEYLQPKFSVRLGNIYEQFGSGLIFRAYEDRSLGFNNSLLGAHIQYAPTNSLRLKLIAGKPRKFLKYVNTEVYGADATLGILPLLGIQTNVLWNLGGSWIKRKDNAEKELGNKYPSDIDMLSIRSDFAGDLFSIGAEYTTKSKALVVTPEKGFQNVKGNALLMNLGVNTAGIGAAFNFRRIENLQLNTDNSLDEESIPLNFIPSLTKQHKYTLPALFPHRVKGVGEIGGQMEIFGTFFMDKEDNHEVNVSLNASYYRNLKEKEGQDGYAFLNFGDKLLFQEIGIEAQSPISEKFEVTIGFIHQKHTEFSRLNFGEMDITSQSMVADMLYRLTDKQSLRLELQHQWSTSKDDQRWVLGLLEYGVAPRLMLYGSMMTNYKTNDEKPTLYYTTGLSYNINRLRVALGFNRSRAGYQCSGGICRYIPEHKGATLFLNYSF